MGKIRDFQSPDIKTIENIINNYIQTEKTLVNQLYFTACHGSTLGGFREDIWKGMFEQIVPRKFAIDQSVFVIDSDGRVSNEVDLVIYDETYTPYIFRYGRMKFIPIEAVAVVVECKSLSLNNDILKNWAESIMVLTTSVKSCARVANRVFVGDKEPNSTQTQTRPLRILCCLNENIINQTLSNDEKLFDIIVRAPFENEGLSIEFNEKKVYLKDWYMALNHVGYPDKSNGSVSWDEKYGNLCDGSVMGERKLADYQVSHKNRKISLLSFNLQLNQLLMLINNPIPFPHIAYAEMFKNSVGGESLDE